MSRSARWRSNASDGTLRFLGGTEVTDYMGPVALPEARPTVAKELFAALARTDDWTEADLRGLPEDQAWFGPAHRVRLRRTGFATEVLDDQNGVAPFLPPAGSYDEYLERLPAKLRHEIKRKARRLEAEVGPWHICPATPETLEAFLDRFVELHRHERGPARASSCSRGWRSSSAGSARRSCPRGIFRPDLHRDGGAPEAAAGSIGFRFERHLLALQLCVRSYVPARVARDGARGRGHPHRRSRPGCSAFDHAEGRLRLQVPVRRRAQQFDQAAGGAHAR